MSSCFTFLSNPSQSRRRNLGLTLFFFVTTTRTRTRTPTKNSPLLVYSGAWLSAYCLITTSLDDSWWGKKSSGIISRKDLQEKSAEKIFRKNLQEKSSGKFFRKTFQDLFSDILFRKNVQEKNLQDKFFRRHLQEKAWISKACNIEKLGPGTKSKSKGEALGQSISLNLVYPPPATHTPPPTFTTLLTHLGP